MSRLHRTRTIKTLTIAAVVAVIVASCGDGASSDPTVAPTTAADVADAGTQPGTTSPPAQAVDAPELGGTSWMVVEYSQGGGIITNVWKTEVTIAFAGDGTFSGSAGCNQYQGTWSVSGGYDEFTSGQPDVNDGQEMLLADLTWAETVCDDDAIMEQEAEVLDLLQNAGRWVLIRDEFHLRSTEGAHLFNAEPA